MYMSHFLSFFFILTKFSQTKSKLHINILDSLFEGEYFVSNAFEINVSIGDDVLMVNTFFTLLMLLKVTDHVMVVRLSTDNKLFQ